MFLAIFGILAILISWRNRSDSFEKLQVFILNFAYIFLCVTYLAVNQVVACSKMSVVSHLLHVLQFDFFHADVELLISTFDFLASLVLHHSGLRVIQPGLRRIFANAMIQSRWEAFFPGKFDSFLVRNEGLFLEVIVKAGAAQTLSCLHFSFI